MSRQKLGMKGHLKQKERQLEDIIEMMEMETETPGYVREIRANSGEDIKSNNFGKMEAVGEFQQIDVREYLEEIEV